MSDDENALPYPSCAVAVLKGAEQGETLYELPYDPVAVQVRPGNPGAPKAFLRIGLPLPTKKLR